MDRFHFFEKRWFRLKNDEDKAKNEIIVLKKFKKNFRFSIIKSSKQIVFVFKNETIVLRKK